MTAVNVRIRHHVVETGPPTGRVVVPRLPLHVLTALNEAPRPPTRRC